MTANVAGEMSAILSYSGINPTGIPAYAALSATIFSDCGFDALPNDSRMLCGYAQECESGSLGRAPTLLPIPEGMNADAQSSSKLLLCKANKSPERGNIFARFQLAFNEPLSNPSRDRAL
jgi:hypothetical protein